MVRAWLMCDEVKDQHSPNQRSPPEPLDIKDLQLLHISASYLDPEDKAALEAYKKDNNYNFSDTVKIGRDITLDYDAKMAVFFKEHIHTDPEIRFVVSGSGYFDVRTLSDEWARIAVETGDLLVVPAGIYHRFTTDSKDYIEAIRLFSGVPVWTPHNRPADDLPARVEYVKSLSKPN